ncbi:MAG: hypothetical protein Tsb0027_24460 [Wenzhouxiangellaceae bacterium]
MRALGLLALVLLLALLVTLSQRDGEQGLSHNDGAQGNAAAALADADDPAQVAEQAASADPRSSAAANTSADSSAATRPEQRAGRNPFRQRAASAQSLTDTDTDNNTESQSDAASAAANEQAAARAAAMAAEDTAAVADEDEDTASGSISGRVMDDQGEPVAGAEVLATQQPDATGKGGGEQYAASAAADGWFRFERLPVAEYIISARDPVTATSSNSVRASTGTPLVDLLIPLLNEVLLFGSVTDSAEQPVAGARIVLAPPAIATSSDELGVYLLPARLRNGQSYLLIVEHNDFATARVPLPEQDWRQTTELQQDVQLQTQRVTTVSGRLLDRDGAAVGNEVLFLQGQRNSYQARADAAGQFRFDAVVPGAGYRLSVQPERDYNSHEQSGIEVPAAGLSGLEVVLEALDEGLVTGQFVDPFGAALPGYSATVLVQRFRTAVQADAQGRFTLEQVPAGDVQLRNDSMGRLSTRGATLAPGGQLQLLAVVDVGTAQYVGTVRNEVGMPVAGAVATLLWRRQDQGLLHESARTAISDANGRFAFSGHAGVDHELRIAAEGYQPLITALSAQTTSSELTLQPLP